MIKEQITIKNANKFDVSLVTLLVDKLSDFDSIIKIEHNNHTVDPKSIISLISMHLNNDDIININIIGDDAQLMFETFIDILKKHDVI